MFKTFSGTLAGASVNLVSVEPAAGWVIFNDSSANTYDLVVGSETVKVGPKETLKLQTNVATVSLNGTGVYRAICFQSLTSFRFFDRQNVLEATLTSTYAPDTVTIDTAPNSSLLAIKNSGVTTAKLAQDVLTLIGNAGLAIIPDGGTLSGTYDKGVLCLGSASITGATIIKGDLYQVVSSSNIITNTGAYALTVHGSAYLREYSNASANANGAVTVYGSLVFATQFVIQSFGGVASSLTVGGDCVGGATSTLSLSGAANTTATSLTVAGNLIGYAFTCAGGASSNSSAAGNGATISIGGDVSINILSGAGGAATSTGNAGNGASVQVRGNVVSTAGITVSGGSATGSSAGNGGTVTVTGRIISGSFSAVGGDCSSTTLAHLAGVGGTVSCNDLRLSGVITTKGGARSGSTTGTGTNTPPSGGNITVTGDLHSTSNVILDGGAVTTASISGVAGAGGTLIVRGDTNTTGSIRSNGGAGSTSSTQVGGAGGTLTLYGSSSADSVSVVGGDSGASATKGAAGNITFGSGCFVSGTVSIKDGSGATNPTASSYLLLGGYCSISTIDAVSRSDMHIKGVTTTTPAVLQVSTLSTKATFNNGAGTATSSITSPETKLFFYAGDAWKQLTGSNPA